MIRCSILDRRPGGRSAMLAHPRLTERGMRHNFDLIQTIDQWMALEKIAQYQDRLKSESDICERKLLEGLITLEKIKLGQRSIR
jgi:hypothetical protein